jgi:hypothetical protein
MLPQATKQAIVPAKKAGSIAFRIEQSGHRESHDRFHHYFRQV